LLPLVYDALLATLLHLDHSLTDVLSIVLFLLLLLDPAAALGLSFGVLLPLPLLGFCLSSEELLLLLFL